MAEADDDQIVDAKAAARVTGLAPATLAKLRCLGGGPAFLKLGRKVSYNRSDLIEWRDARRVRNTTEAALALPRRLTDPPEDSR
jgi:hypothetical protein